MSDDANKDDKQFEASEQKLRKARADGDVPRSTEINVLAMYVGFWAAIAGFGSFVADRWLTMAANALAESGSAAPRRLLQTSFDLGGWAGLATLAAAGMGCAAIIAGLVMQRGFAFSTKKLAFDFKRINPVRNAAQKFGKSGLMTFAISTTKAALICAGGWLLFSSWFDRLAATALGADQQWAAGLTVLLGQVLMLAIAVSAAFAVIDFSWKKHEYAERQKMSRKDVEDEHKSSEGDPHMKSARRRRAVDIAMHQMLADVEEADVVIVNPTHYAVALQWKRGSGRVPVCLAKGTDDVAARIRDRASKHKVPVYSDPPTARALHATVGLGEEIHREHFAAVAIAIRFAEKLRFQARQGW